MYIADMLSRAYLINHKKKEVKDYEVFRLAHEEQLFKEINQAQHLHMQEATQAQIKKGSYNANTGRSGTERLAGYTQ